jgi:Flp pilus assembly protein TadD
MGSGGKANGTAEHMYAEVRRRLDLGDPAGARQQLEKMLTVYPHVALVHNDLAVLYYQSGDKVQALRHYEEAVKLQSGNLTFQKNLADFYYIEQGRIQDALKAYIRILETTPQDIETLLAVGKICKELHETDDARTFFTRVLEIEPWNHSAAENLNQLVSAKPFQQAERRADEMYAEATRLSSSGDIQAASMALERLVGVHPDFALAYNDLGVLSYQAGEKQAALKYHQRAVQLEPANLTFQKNLADCYWIGFGRLEDALKIYTGILSAHPEDVETLLAIGKACLSTRQPDDARVMFDRVLEIEPWNAEARQQLKELNALNRAA